VPLPRTRGELFAFADLAWRDELNFLLYESAEFRSDTFADLGLRIGQRRADGAFEASIFGRNVLDETVLEGGVDFNNLTGFVNEPPLWGLELRTRL